MKSVRKPDLIYSFPAGIVVAGEKQENGQEIYRKSGKGMLEWRKKEFTERTFIVKCWNFDAVPQN